MSGTAVTRACCQLSAEAQPATGQVDGRGIQFNVLAVPEFGSLILLQLHAMLAPVVSAFFLLAAGSAIKTKDE